MDGETIEAEINGQVVGVRIIGVDTPETIDPNGPVMCFGPEATAFTIRVIGRVGWQAYLETDISDTDRLERTLTYQELTAHGRFRLTGLRLYDMIVPQGIGRRDEGSSAVVASLAASVCK